MLFHKDLDGDPSENSKPKNGESMKDSKEIPNDTEIDKSDAHNKKTVYSSLLVLENNNDEREKETITAKLPIKFSHQSPRHGQHHLYLLYCPYPRCYLEVLCCVWKESEY